MAQDTKLSSDITRRFEVWERHGQTIMLAITLAALTFTGNFMWDVNGKLAELQIENKYLSSQVSEMKGTLIAMQSSYVTRNEFSDAMLRLRSLEQATRNGK